MLETYLFLVTSGFVSQPLPLVFAGPCFFRQFLDRCLRKGAVIGEEFLFWHLCWLLIFRIYRFQRENLNKLDINQRAQFATQAIASWLGFRLQMLGVAMVTGIAFIAVLEHHFQTADPGIEQYCVV